MMSDIPLFEEVMACEKALFEWADSFDAKDWTRLRACLAPSLVIEYPSLPPADQVKSAEQFVEMVSKPQFLGNHLIKTQHFIGVGRWQKLSQDEIIGTRQVRIAHQRYKDDSFKEVLVKGHDHGTATFRFRRIEGVWRFAGLKPNNRWSEFERDKVFADSL